MPPPSHQRAMAVNHLPPGATHMPCPKATICSWRCLVHGVPITGINVPPSRMPGQKAWEEIFAPVFALELFYTFFESVTLTVCNEDEKYRNTVGFGGPIPTLNWRAQACFQCTELLQLRSCQDRTARWPKRGHTHWQGAPLR